MVPGKTYVVLPGADGVLGTADAEWVSGENPLGVNPHDRFGKDDLIIEGGEVRIQAAFAGIDPMPGQPADTATLCRCGRSKNKPYCDGRHKGRKGFR